MPQTYVVNTILCDGQCIMPRVMEGIISQSIECCLMPITSRRDWSKDRRFNMIENWREAFRHCDEEIFIGMDSDVVLTHPKAVETLVNRLKDNKELLMTTMPSKPYSKLRYFKGRIDHQLFAVRRKDFPIFEELKLSDCPICQTIKKMRSEGKKIECIEEIRLEECAKKFIRRR